MKIIVTTCKGRGQHVEYLQKLIPNLIINFDDFKNGGKFTSTAWFNYQRSWELAGESPTLQLDDDIILCHDFIDKVSKVIAERPNDVVQFFSMRKADIEKGSRYESGSKFLMQQCYYLPKGMAKELYEYSLEWYKKETTHKNCPTDICMAEFFKERKIKYWNHVPNLVDHRIGKSAISSRRSSKRQSLTFKK